MPFSWKDFASKWFRCKLLVCWDREPRTLDIAFGLTRDCRQGVSAWFSSDSSYFFLSAKYVHWERSPTGFDWGLDFGRAWVGVKQGRESWWRLLKTCFMFNRVQRGSLKPAVGSVEKSAGPEQWLWHNRKQKNTSSPECFYSSDIRGGNKTPDHLRTELYLQGIISRQMIARALILAQTQNWANMSAGLLN